ncbi:Clavaminate synthase-like protein [Armillaria mellea]|nr:Clavaminate synthase-like protein [Armillaria mellea]
MPVAAPQLGSYKYVPETKDDLDWADLVTVDLSLYSTPEGKKQLRKTLIEAVREKGFFYVKNFNISQDRVDRQFALGKRLFERPVEEKSAYTPDMGSGKVNGYIPAGRKIINAEAGIRDRTEMYNIPKFNDYFPQVHPPVIVENLNEVEAFAKSLHSEVLDPLFVLLAIALELPEDTFTSVHKYEEKSEVPEEENKKLTNWSYGHTDLGSFTLLFRQPVAALQIRYHSTGEWKWVKPQDATLTVNACDALSFLTGGYVKSTVHRVTHVDRLGLLYFSRPHNDVPLATVKNSEVLKRAEHSQNQFESSGNKVPTMEEWTFAKQTWQRAKGSRTGEFSTATILPGFKEQVYV